MSCLEPINPRVLGFIDGDYDDDDDDDDDDWKSSEDVIPQPMLYIRTFVSGQCSCVSPSSYLHSILVVIFDRLYYMTIDIFKIQHVK